MNLIELDRAFKQLRLGSANILLACIRAGRIALYSPGIVRSMLKELHHLGRD